MCHGKIGIAHGRTSGHGVHCVLDFLRDHGSFTFLLIEFLQPVGDNSTSSRSNQPRGQRSDLQRVAVRTDLEAHTSLSHLPLIVKKIFKIYFSFPASEEHRNGANYVSLV